MKRVMFFSILIGLLGILQVTQASEEFDKGNFSITLTDGWTELPRDVIDTYTKEIMEMDLNLPKLHYDYVFQLDGWKDGFEYPYIVIQIDSLGRVPERQLEKMESLSFQEKLDERAKDYSPIISDMQTGKVYYDKNTNIIWMRIEFNMVEIGPIMGISGTILTEKGYIQVSGFALQKNFLTYRTIFRNVILSVVPDPELVYQPKWSDSLRSDETSNDSEPAKGKFVILGCLVLILYCYFQHLMGIQVAFRRGGISILDANWFVGNPRFYYYTTLISILLLLLGAILIIFEAKWWSPLWIFVSLSLGGLIRRVTGNPLTGGL